MRLVYSAISLLTIISYLGCINPFAPESGDISGSMVPDASTVGGMLELFEYSYNTKDSLYYSQLLDSSFVFQYYDAANSRYDQWYRYTDLKATGGLFRNFEVIDLSWYLPDSAVLAFDYTDSLVQVIVNFNLTLDNTVIYGFARFDCYKRSGGKFKITAWKDDF